MSLSVTKFVRGLDPADLLHAYGATDGVQTFNLPVPKGCSFDPTRPGVGTEFHDAFAAMNQGSRIDRDYYHYVQALRDWLFDQGAARLWTEWEYFYSGQHLHGTVDASITGGPKPYGLLEIKVQGEDPEDGFVEDWAQLACYCQLAAQSGRPIKDQWAALAYVIPRQKIIRVLMVTDVRRLTDPLKLLKAA